jgi:hypothetical protein
MINLLLALILFQAPNGSGTIKGTVLNPANEGLFGARVEVAGGAQGPMVSRTDGQGRFVFSSVPPGRYRVSVQKEEYVRQEYGQKVPGGTGTLIVIEPGTQVQGLVFRLQPASTLAGSVRNEDGIPIANILVQAMRRSYGVRGNRTVTLFSNALTDDLGTYRLYWLDPGEYYVNASYLPQLPTSVNANEDAPRAAYAATYYPGSANPVDAKVVRLESGNVFGGIDFRLQRSPAVNVSGTIYSVLTQANIPAVVTLMSPEESGSTARHTIRTNEKGVFEMKAVNPGTYVLSARSASEDGLIGFSIIRVADIDYPRADVIIGPGVTVTARLFGDVPPATDLRGMKISLLPLETFLPMPGASIIQPNGLPAIPNVQPGAYLLSVSGLPDTGYVRAARSDQRDILERFVEVQYGMQAPLDIQLAFDGGQMAGTVADAAGQRADRATVVLIPDPARRHRPDQYRVVTSANDGTFSVRGIPPGEYKVFAWDSIEANAWLNSDFVLNYEEFGAAVAVGASEKVTAQIRLIRN